MGNLYKDYLATEGNRFFTYYISPSLKGRNRRNSSAKARMHVVSRGRLLSAAITTDTLNFPDSDSNGELAHSKLVRELPGKYERTIEGWTYKRLFDIVFSLIVMIGGAPLFGVLYFITKFSSPGPAFYRQERVGRNEHIFYIYKFRSMYVDAEKSGPQLSSANDPRITNWGRFIRRSRFDELPQFWNVLKGEMSIVGPRPERRFFIDQLVEHAPRYKKLLSLRPGLTSLGQVKYGYAENVQEMRHRLRYDLVYLNNISFNTDLRIILQTVKIMTQLKGK